MYIRFLYILCCAVFLPATVLGEGLTEYCQSSEAQWREADSAYAEDLQQILQMYADSLADAEQTEDFFSVLLGEVSPCLEGTERLSADCRIPILAACAIEARTRAQS